MPEGIGMKGAEVSAEHRGGGLGEGTVLLDARCILRSCSGPSSAAHTRGRLSSVQGKANEPWGL